MNFIFKMFPHLKQVVSDDIRNWYLNDFTRNQFTYNQKITQERKKGKNFFMIMKGKVLISRGNKRICELTEDAVFGEELFYQRRYKYTATCKCDELVCLALNADLYGPDHPDKEKVSIPAQLMQPAWQQPR